MADKVSDLADKPPDLADKIPDPANKPPDLADKHPNMANKISYRNNHHLTDDRDVTHRFAHSTLYWILPPYY